MGIVMEAGESLASFPGVTAKPRPVGSLASEQLLHHIGQPLVLAMRQEPWGDPYLTQPLQTQRARIELYEHPPVMRGRDVGFLSHSRVGFLEGPILRAKDIQQYGLYLVHRSVIH